MKLVDMRVTDFLDEVDSPSPAPGGGSVSALVSALGASLVRMVAHLTFGKKKYEGLPTEEKTLFERSFKELLIIKNDLSLLVDADTVAYNMVMEAYRMPKENDVEQEIRKIMIQKALKEAVSTPLEICRLSVRGMGLMQIITDLGNKNAITDLGVALHLFFTGLEGGILNVKINLSSIEDEDFKRGVEQEIALLFVEAQERKRNVAEKLEEYLR